MAEDNSGRSGIRSHRDLIVWQRSIELTLAVYKATQNFPREEAYGLTSQLRRASVSIASNIAEGYGRHTRRDYSHFLIMARGSTREVQTQLYLAAQLMFGSSQEIADADGLSEQVVRMLNAILAKLAASGN